MRLLHTHIHTKQRLFLVVLLVKMDNDVGVIISCFYQKETSHLSDRTQCLILFGV